MKKLLLLACLISTIALTSKAEVLHPSIEHEPGDVGFYNDPQKDDTYERYLLTCIDKYMNTMSYDKVIGKCDCATKKMIDTNYQLMSLSISGDATALTKSLKILSTNFSACPSK